LEVYRLLNKWAEAVEGFGPTGSAGDGEELEQPVPHTPNDN
jgi:hypothetical protein